MGNCTSTNSKGDRRVTSYSFYTTEFENSLQFGDLLEFNRGAYSHWGMYYENGHVVHLHIAEGREFEAITQGEGFVPASVRSDPLKDVAGLSLTRVNNKPEYKRQPRRPPDDVLRIIKILLSGNTQQQEEAPEEGTHAHSYCLLYFNCEHFATFLKFEGLSKSDQILGWNKSHAYLSLCQKAERLKSDVRIFNTLAYLQWLENVRAAGAGEEPRKVLEEGILEMDQCREIVKEDLQKRRFSVDSLRRSVNYKGSVASLGKERPVLYSPEFIEAKKTQ